MRRFWVIIPLLGGLASLLLLAFIGPLGELAAITSFLSPPERATPSTKAPVIEFAELPPILATSAKTDLHLAALDSLASPPQRAVAEPAITTNVARPILGPPPLTPPLVEEKKPLEKRVVPEPPSLEAPTPEDLSPEETLASSEEPPPATWPRPTALETQLRLVTGESDAKIWAYGVQDAITELCTLPLTDKNALRAVFSHLEELAAEAPSLAAQAVSEPVRRNLLALAYDISRRIDIWRAVLALQEPGVVLTAANDAQRNEEDLQVDLQAAIASIGAYLETEELVQAWGRYLKFSELEAQKAARPVSPSHRADLALQVLHRMVSPRLRNSQRKLLQNDAFADFKTLLRHWVTQPIAMLKLLHSIEDFEHSGNAASATMVAVFIDQMHYSLQSGARTLGARLEAHYRNANLRFAVAQELINRSLPATEPTAEEVRDRILQAEVTGRSTTTNRISFNLTPDPSRWNFSLLANGRVQSDTASDAGSAVFFSNGRAQFLVQKQIHWSTQHLTIFPAAAEARSRNQLLRVRTDFDSIPLFGLLAQSVAVQQHGQHETEVQRIVERKIAAKAEHRMDREIDEKFNQAFKNFDDHLLQPLRSIGVNPTSVSLQTTSRRLISRSRLAGASQLAAFTARPRAPSDSWLSVQLHQSAVNNVLNQLGVAGRPLKLRELIVEIHSKLGLTGHTPPDDLPEGVWLQLAKEEPLKITCEEGVVHCQVRLRHLKQGRRHWENIVAHARYSPVLEGMVVSMQREKPIELTGRRLSFGDQIALRAIFSKVFSKRRPPRLSLSETLGEEKTQGLEVTQWSVHRGWIGLAIAPRRSPLATLPEEIDLAAERKEEATASRSSDASNR